MIDIDELKRDRAAGTQGPWVHNVMCEDVGDPYLDYVSGNGRVVAGETTETDARRIARVPDLEAAYIALAARVKAADELAERAYHVFQSEYTNTRHLEGAKAYYDANMQALAAYRTHKETKK